jgi:crotonobetainyl-CoA:carnitine CoA-transferase CaiB-like acyl-CoA transferase
MATAFEPEKQGPLAGVRVLDLSRLLAGNILTHVLADLGADVIKLEPPGGDSLRAWKENGHEVQWKVYARNKRSIVIDLKNEDDRKIFRALLKTADALVENYRPGVLDRLGFPLSELHSIQPKLVVVRISGWGATGPYKNKPGFGTLVEAASGYAFKNGFTDRPPLLPNLGLADSVTGLYGAACALVALREAEKDGGLGQELDLALFDSFLQILGADQAIHHVTGQVVERSGNRSNLAAPRNVYSTSDQQFIALSASTPELAFRLFDAIGRPDMKSDSRFSTNPARLKNVDELDEIIAGFIGARTLSENLAHFESLHVTVAAINDAAAVMRDPHVMARGSILMMDDEDVGSLPMHAVPCRFSTTPGSLRAAAPKLDAHRAQILEELGLADERSIPQGAAGNETPR